MINNGGRGPIKATRAALKKDENQNSMQQENSN